MVVPAYVGHEEVGEVDGGEGDAGGAEAGAEPDHPEDRVAVLLLRRPRHLQQRVPQPLPLALRRHGGHLVGGDNRFSLLLLLLQARDLLRRRMKEEGESMRGSGESKNLFWSLEEEE